MGCQEEPGFITEEKDIGVMIKRSLAFGPGLVSTFREVGVFPKAGKMHHMGILILCCSLRTEIPHSLQLYKRFLIHLTQETKGSRLEGYQPLPPRQKMHIKRLALTGNALWKY